MKCASCRPTACAFRASSSACSGGIERPSLRAERSNPVLSCRSGLLRRGACHRAALRADPLAPRNDKRYSLIRLDLVLRRRGVARRFIGRRIRGRGGGLCALCTPSRHPLRRPRSIVILRPRGLDDEARAVAAQLKCAAVVPGIATDHFGGTARRRIVVHGEDQSRAGAIVLERFGLDRVSDQRAVVELADATESIAGDALPKAL